MSDIQKETDQLVGKITAMEVMLLTLIRPMAQNPRFWTDVDAVAKAFEGHNNLMDGLSQRRWAAARGFLDEWRRALTPPPGPPAA